jgi:shikimate dehydrogenase
MRSVRAGVIGFPVEHSLSPAIFEFLGQKTKLSIDYKAMPVDPAQLQPVINEIKVDPDFLGVNVTIPHKETVLKYLEAASPEALALGAVNVISKTDKRLTGRNTDVYGITASLREKNISLRFKRALVIGSGGAARAACYALGESTCSIVEIAGICEH